MPPMPARSGIMAASIRARCPFSLLSSPRRASYARRRPRRGRARACWASLAGRVTIPDRRLCMVRILPGHLRRGYLGLLAVGLAALAWLVVYAPAGAVTLTVT